jgi:hypothetical protein
MGNNKIKDMPKCMRKESMPKSMMQKKERKIMDT